MSLFEKFRILHRDVSINNTMIYVADIPENEGNEDEGCSGEFSDGGSPQQDNGGLHHPGALGGEAVDNQEDKHVHWERERQQQIRDGILRSGLLINFDYASDLDQVPSLVSGECSV